MTNWYYDEENLWITRQDPDDEDSGFILCEFTKGGAPTEDALDFLLDSLNRIGWH